MPVNPIDKYLADVPEKDRIALEKLRHTILSTLPKAEEVISYGIPCFKLNGRAVVGFAAFKNHCTYFAWSGSVLGQLKKELSKFSYSKSGIHFTSEKPIPATLIKKIIKIRLEENKLKDSKKTKPHAKKTQHQ
jgi:uncharacterized protein YdhG (YjbR/CyaY superfamily)